jgi:protein ImuB
MPRVVSLFLPSWPTDRLRRTLGAAAPPAEAPLVLIGREGRQRVVLAMDAAAWRAGLRVGMPAAKAQALVPGLIVRDAEPAADAKALDRLALWALQRYAPIAAADPPDGLVIDTTGAAHLHGGEDAMVKGMVKRLAASGIAARAAIADSWGAAHAFARTEAGPALAVPVGESAKAILGLPIAALRLPKTMVEDLSVLGFARIGELAAKPRAPLALRFGPELCRRLDQAMGSLSEPIDPVRPPDLIEVRRVFAEPIGAAETIARYTGKLTPALRSVGSQRPRRAAARSSPLSDR